MADNYIERQFEQYQAKKAAWQKPLKHTSKKTNSKRVFYNRRSQRHWQSHCKSISTKEKLSGSILRYKDETSGLQTAKETGAAFYLVDIQE